MILTDNSAWIEFLRATGSLANLAVREGLSSDDLAICDVILMELLAGASSGAQLRRVRTLLAQAEFVPMLTTDYEDAAALYRQCRRGGETVRKLNDCLIGAVAVRVRAPVLHRDAGFDVLARHTAMQTYVLTQT